MSTEFQASEINFESPDFEMQLCVFPLNLIAYPLLHIPKQSQLFVLYLILSSLTHFFMSLSEPAFLQVEPLQIRSFLPMYQFNLKIYLQVLLFIRHF